MSIRSGCGAKKQGYKRRNVTKLSLPVFGFMLAVIGVTAVLASVHWQMQRTALDNSGRFLALEQQTATLFVQNINKTLDQMIAPIRLLDQELARVFADPGQQARRTMLLEALERVYRRWEGQVVYVGKGTPPEQIGYANAELVERASAGDSPYLVEAQMIQSDQKHIDFAWPLRWQGEVPGTILVTVPFASFTRLLALEKLRDARLKVMQGPLPVMTVGDLSHISNDVQPIRLTIPRLDWVCFAWPQPVRSALWSVEALLSSTILMGVAWVVLGIFVVFYVLKRMFSSDVSEVSQMLRDLATGEGLSKMYRTHLIEFNLILDTHAEISADLLSGGLAGRDAVPGAKRADRGRATTGNAQTVSSLLVEDVPHAGSGKPSGSGARSESGSRDSSAGAKRPAPQAHPRTTPAGDECAQGRPSTVMTKTIAGQHPDDDSRAAAPNAPEATTEAGHVVEFQLDEARRYRLPSAEDRLKVETPPALAEKDAEHLVEFTAEHSPTKQ